LLSKCKALSSNPKKKVVIYLKDTREMWQPNAMRDLRLDPVPKK
jgi:hypothetical protein